MKDKEPVIDRKPQRLHPDLTEKLAQDLATNRQEKISVIINFEENIALPPLFQMDPNEPSASPINQTVEEANQQIVKQIEDRRKETYSRTKKYLASVGAEVTNEFWLINAVVATVPLTAINSILQDKSVIYIEPTTNKTIPPGYYVSDARAHIASDPYYIYSSGHIGLLDTGVRSNHTLLAGRLRYVFDCTFRVFFFGPYCGTNGGPEDDMSCNHGTSTAAIMSSNGNLGNSYRGVTQIEIDSYRVYDHSGNCYLDIAAALAAFQQATSHGNNIIVAEMQATGNYNSSLSVAADNAFDAGCIIIAANGNFNTGANSVRVPASAHKAIGVGALDVNTLAWQSYQGLGPTDDGRVKPDIQAPTNTYTASAASSTATRSFTGTSGSTPYAAGAAALLRSRWQGLSLTEPGYVYASLINGGENTANAAFDNTNGAGLIKVTPPYSLTGQMAGKVFVSNGQTIDIPVGGLGVSTRHVDCAIWWPENRASHNDIDLKLINPSNVAVDFSASTNSVFEKVNSRNTLYTGALIARIYGYSVSGSQVVYYNCKRGL
jgi:serine protease AprX